MKTSGPCKFEDSILCAVVKNQDNCCFHNAQECRDNNGHVVNWLAEFKDPTIVLTLVRYNINRIQTSVLGKQMCPKCRIIYKDVPEIKGCAICDNE